MSGSSLFSRLVFCSSSFSERRLLLYLDLLVTVRSCLLARSAVGVPFESALSSSVSFRARGLSVCLRSEQLRLLGVELLFGDSPWAFRRPASSCVITSSSGAGLPAPQHRRPAAGAGCGATAAAASEWLPHSCPPAGGSRRCGCSAVPTTAAVRAIPLISPGISASFSVCCQRGERLVDEAPARGVSPAPHQRHEGVHKGDRPEMLDRQSGRRAGHHALDSVSASSVSTAARLVDEAHCSSLFRRQVLEIEPPQLVPFVLEQHHASSTRIVRG